MLLAIDVGNTNTVIGLYQGKTLLDHWRIATRAGRTYDEIGILLRSLFADRYPEIAGQITGAIVSSVVPPLTRTLVRMVDRYFGLHCLVVGPGLKTGMPILYEDPREVGADRIVNAIAAYERFSCGLVIVDFGTATTFDVVNPEGSYLGGAICPGVGISSQALFEHAARLPRVEFSRPKFVVGRNTVSSIQSGLVFGYVSMVDGLVRRIQAEVDYPTKVVATGGLAPLIATESETLEHVDEMLTLEGLRLIFERNE